MDSPHPHAYEPSPLLRLWDRLPLALRALLSGLVVFLALQFGWNVLVAINIAATPAIPWHAPAGLIYLWLVWRYFGGRWAPASTSPRRAQALRARRLSTVEWRSALGACAAVAVFIITFAMLNYRFIAVPEDGSDLSVYPWWTVYITLIMVSIVAGVSEEAGFRGYMQAPLEKRFGPGLAITFTATIFWLAHLNHSSGLARGPSLMVMGFALGTLAFSTRSIYPPLVTHAFADSVVFVGAQSEVGPDWLWSPPLYVDSGLDAPLVGTILVALATGSFAVLAMGRLRRAGPAPPLPPRD